MLVFPAAIFRFIAILINTKILAGDFVEIYKQILKLLQKWKGLSIFKTTLKKKNKVGELVFPDLNVSYKATLIKTV